MEDIEILKENVKEAFKDGDNFELVIALIEY